MILQLHVLKPPVCSVGNVNSSRGPQTSDCPAVQGCCCCQSQTGLRSMAHMSHAGGGGQDYFNRAGDSGSSQFP